MPREIARLLVAVCIVATWMAVHAAEPIKIEFHVLQSGTLSDQQFLTGMKTSAPTALGAELRLPTSKAPRLPAVLMLHGSNGFSDTGDRWAAQFNDMGFATLRIDSFTGRGITSTVADQSQLGELVMSYDAYRAYDLLAKHPRIDATRIALFGSSRGGVGTLYASVSRFQRMHATPGTSFAAYVALYPLCARTYIEDDRVAPRPIRILSGTADVIAPIEQCRSYVGRLRSAGADVQLIEYEGAHHGFDGRALVSPASTPAAPDGVPARGCDLFEQPAGRIVNRETGAPFARSDSCLKRPRFTAYHAEAHAEAERYVRETLQKALGQVP